MDDDDDSNEEYDNKINEDKDKIQSKISDNSNNTDNTVTIRTEDSYDKNKASNE